MRQIKIVSFVGMVLLFGTALTYGSEKPLTLQDCYGLAQIQSESLKIQMEDVTQAKARKNQARSGVLPDLRWKQTTVWQDTSGVTQFNDDGTISNALNKRYRTANFNLTQPIFHGFKEFSAISAFAAQIRQETYALTRENVLLYRDVAQSFLTAVLFETDLSNIRTTIKLSQDRIRELNERVRVGRSRDSEVVSADSQQANLKSREARTIGDISLARENLGFLVGKDMEALPLMDNMERPPLIPVEEALQMAEARSDVKSLQEEVEAKRYAIRVARADFWPDLRTEGNYYTHRSGLQDEVDWDVALNIDVPIFQGGKVASQSSAAVSQWKQARLLLDQKKRQVRTEIKQAHAALSASLQESDFLEEAYKKAKKSYDLQVKEYRYGLVSNLDVLQTLSAMQEFKQNWDRALVQSKLNYIALLTATEQFLYDPL